MALTWCLSGSWPCVWNLRCVCGTLKICWFHAGLHAELLAVRNPFWMSKISTLRMAATERNQRSPGRLLIHTSSLHKKVMKRVSFCDLCHKTLWAKQFAKGCAGDFDWTSHVAVVFLKSTIQTPISFSVSSFLHCTHKIWGLQRPFPENFAGEFAKTPMTELQMKDLL